MYRYSRFFDPPAPALTLQILNLDDRAEIELLAQIDTGADLTVLPASAIARLGVSSSGAVNAVGLDGAPAAQPLYGVLIRAPSKELLFARTITWDAEYALLGRDILNQWRIVLDGPALSMTI